MDSDGRVAKCFKLHMLRLILEIKAGRGRKWYRTGLLCRYQMANKQHCQKNFLKLCIFISFAAKRAAPPRPTVPPPIAQPRTPSPLQQQSQPPASEPPPIPKALPRKTAGGLTRAPSIPPPLPPQPARRLSRNAPPSPKPPSEPVSNEAPATEEPPANDCSVETSEDSMPLATGHDEPTSVGEKGTPSASDPKMQALEND